MQATGQATQQATRRAPRRRRGHPAKVPATRLGAYVLSAIEVAGSTYGAVCQQLGVSRATLRRWLDGATQATRRITLEGAADALCLTGADRHRFVQTCASCLAHPTGARAVPPAMGPAAVGKRSGGGTARPASTPFGAELQLTLREAGMSQRELARRLGVSRATITHLIHGVRRRVYSMTAASVADALGLTGMRRREFLERAAQAGAFALAGAFEAHTLVLLRRPKLDLAEMKQRLDALAQAQDQGKTLQVMRDVAEVYRALARTPLRQNDPTPAALKIQAASLLATVQEAVIPWFNRSQQVVAVYTRLEQEVLSHFPVANFAASRAYIAGRKAPLYREAGQFEEGLLWFTYAIEQYVPYAQDLSLEVELYRNRAHIYAVQGAEKQWRSDIERARTIARRCASPLREVLLGQIMYSEGEGLKRLIVASPSPAHRKTYAQNALDTLEQSLAMFHPAMGAHGLLVGVSEAQCLEWLDPAEAIAQVERLRPQATLIYPAMIAKIERVISTARRRLDERDTHRRAMPT